MNTRAPYSSLGGLHAVLQRKAQPNSDRAVELCCHSSMMIPPMMTRMESPKNRAIVAKIVSLVCPLRSCLSRFKTSPFPWQIPLTEEYFSNTFQTNTASKNIGEERGPNDLSPCHYGKRSATSPNSLLLVARLPLGLHTSDELFVDRHHVVWYLDVVHVGSQLLPVVRGVPGRLGCRLALGQVVHLLAHQHPGEARDWIDILALRVRRGDSKLQVVGYLRSLDGCTGTIHAGLHEVTLLADAGVGYAVLYGVLEAHVTYRVRGLLYLTGDALVALAADSDGPVDLTPRAWSALPRRTDRC